MISLLSRRRQEIRKNCANCRCIRILPAVVDCRSSSLSLAGCDCHRCTIRGRSTSCARVSFFSHLFFLQIGCSVLSPKTHCRGQTCPTEERWSPAALLHAMPTPPPSQPPKQPLLPVQAKSAPSQQEKSFHLPKLPGAASSTSSKVRFSHRIEGGVWRGPARRRGGQERGLLRCSGPSSSRVHVAPFRVSIGQETSEQSQIL